MEMTIAKSNAFFVTATLMVGALALSACSNASRTLGLDPAPPDEFTVVSKAPLSIPPDFNLRPPKPGAARPQEQTPTTRAQAALVGDAQPAASAPTTPGETALLQVARAQDANPNIRQVLNTETTQLAERDGDFVDRLLSRVGLNLAPSEDEVVNAKEEERRLRQQKAASNTSANAQEAPIIRRKSRSTLSKVF
jgi:hypothetical protein